MLLVTLQAGSGLNGTTTGSVASRHRVSRRRGSDVTTGGPPNGHGIVVRGIRNATHLVMLSPFNRTFVLAGQKFSSHDSQ